MNDWMLLMRKATVDDIKRWTLEIEADEQARYGSRNVSDIDAWAQQQDLDAAYDKLRQTQDDERVLRMLKLAGIQKTLDMSDEEFMKRGRKAIKDAVLKKKREEFNANKKK